MPPSPRKGAAKKIEVADARFSIDYCRGDRRWFRENCVKVRTKEGKLEPFHLNYTQRVIEAKIDELRALGIPPRIYVLKSRQVGVSTYAEYRLFEDGLLNAHRASLVIAHKEDAAKGLFRMTRRFNRFLPEQMQTKMRADNVSAIEFPHDSRMQVEAEGEVRSMTVNCFHGSEIAFWKTPKETLRAGLQAMPRTVDSLGILETTANGQGNLAHEMWCAAIANVENEKLSPWEIGWFPIFIPWFKHEEYILAAHEVGFKPSDTTQDERVLAHRFKLNMRQIAWRRWCIANNCGGDHEVFQVEYPSTWQEAFLLSGRPVFPSDQLEYYAKDAPPQKVEGSVWAASEPKEIEWDREKKVQIVVPQPKGRLRIFAEPNPRHSYVLFADPSEGDRKSDPTPIEVLDQMNFEQAAEWHGRVPPDVLAQFAAWLGWLYNGGLNAGEANNHGILFFSTLLDMNYPNIYFRQTHEESVAGEITYKPGLMQTNKTKHAAFDTGRQFVRERKGRIHSPILLGEMATAQYDRKDEEQATKIIRPPGCHIDAALSWCCSLLIHRGAMENPLLPLPENELYVAADLAAIAREREGLAAGEKVALELTGMTGVGLERLLDIRRAKKERAARGFGGAR